MTRTEKWEDYRKEISTITTADIKKARAKRVEQLQKPKETNYEDLMTWFEDFTKKMESEGLFNVTSK